MSDSKFMFFPLIFRVLKIYLSRLRVEVYRFLVDWRIKLPETSRWLTDSYLGVAVLFCLFRCVVLSQHHYIVLWSTKGASSYVALGVFFNNYILSLLGKLLWDNVMEYETCFMECNQKCHFCEIYNFV